MAYVEAITLFFPIAVVVECGAALFFSIFDGRGFAEAFENLAERAFVFGRQGVVKSKIAEYIESGTGLRSYLRSGSSSVFLG